MIENVEVAKYVSQNTLGRKRTSVGRATHMTTRVARGWASGVIQPPILRTHKLDNDKNLLGCELPFAVACTRERFPGASERPLLNANSVDDPFGLSLREVAGNNCRVTNG